MAKHEIETRDRSNLAFQSTKPAGVEQHRVNEGWGRGITMNVRSIRNFLFALVVMCMSAASFAQIGIAITFAPPPLPVYEQPLCPGDGYLWTPGYWAYDYDIEDYYWVPGTWVEAPEVGYLWTPAYWGWGGDRFVFYDGYWGPHVGFYGGISYGFGYFGEGYEGGRWDHDHFFYNRSVNNVNITNIHNVYNTTIINRTETRVSYNGGNGGIDRRPRREDEMAARDRHLAPVAAQTQHIQEARRDPQQRASVNLGKPAVAGTARAGQFRGGAVVAARAAGGNYTPPARRGGNQPGNNAPAMRPENARPQNNNSPARPENRPADNNSRPNTFSHVRDLPPAPRPSPPNTGNPKQDQKYQQQQQKQFAKQDQERQKLQQKQEQDHQRMAQRNANEAQKQQVEQRHQQQTQQLQQRHEQQQQHMQQKQQPPANQSKPKRP